MRVNADFSKRVVIRPGESQWVPSPHAGVERLQLDRIGEEVARATSFVCFTPGSCFPHHVHGGGEEIFVIEGAFEDEWGVHRAGAYLRSPHGSSHTPTSAQGCVLFVKLWQFDPADDAVVSIDTISGEWRKAPEGFAIQPLHHFGGETSFLVRLDAGAGLARMIHPDGEEMVVLSGSCTDGEGEYPERSWVRDPGGHAQALFSASGCVLYVKTGHLAAARQATAPIPEQTKD